MLSFEIIKINIFLFLKKDQEGYLKYRSPRQKYKVPEQEQSFKDNRKSEIEGKIRSSNSKKVVRINTEYNKMLSHPEFKSKNFHEF